MQRNLARLKEYKEKLVLFPKRQLAKPGKGEASPAEQAAATQLRGAPLPLAKPVPAFPFAKVAQEVGAFSTLRVARTDAKLVGVREKMKKDKAAAAEKGDGKKKKDDAAGDDE